MNLETTKKEKVYFVLSVLVSILVYYYIAKYIANTAANPQLLATNIILIVYLVLIILFFIFSHIIMIGRLHGNAIKVTNYQFPEIYNLVIKNCERINLTRIPTVYLMQSGGVLNAFATRFIGRNYIVLYSDIMEKAFDDGIDVVDFIIAHELIHVKKKHVLKGLLILPANILFLLTLAYSRACEYTCDLNASKLSPEGYKNGLVLLSAGKHLYERVQIDRFIEDALSEKTFAKWFAELLSTHPHISNRINFLIKKENRVV